MLQGGTKVRMEAPWVESLPDIYEIESIEHVVPEEGEPFDVIHLVGIEGVWGFDCVVEVVE